MSEIKYRAWSVFDKQMYSVKSIDFNDMRINLNGADLHNSLVGLELMQYTGLRDKNGKEIYEGDIVIFTLGDYQIKGEVIKDYGCYTIIFNGLDNEKLESNTDYSSSYNGLYIDNYLTFIEIIWNFEVDFEGSFKTIEIIGNVHENKNLLEG